MQVVTGREAGGATGGSALPGPPGLGGHGGAAKGAGLSCQAAGVRPAPQLVPATLEEQEQADELWNKTHCLV